MELDPNLPGPWAAGNPLETDTESPEESVADSPPLPEGRGAPCSDCVRNERTSAMIGMGIGIMVGAAAFFILTREPKR